MCTYYFYNFHSLRPKIVFIFVQHHVQNNNHINQIFSIKSPLILYTILKLKNLNFHQFFHNFNKLTLILRYILKVGLKVVLHYISIL